MDWTGCELVERIPGKVSGQPIVRGTRILADTILQYADRGSSIGEILEDLSWPHCGHHLLYDRVRPSPAQSNRLVSFAR
jgi:uncharacterized protein (DUF433 family)